MVQQRHAENTQSTSSTHHRQEETAPQSSTPASLVIQRAFTSPGSLSPTDVLTLQRSVGNRATRRLLSPVLQPTLKLGAANDRYEQEADRVAQQVVSKIDRTPQSLQRDDEGIEREPVQPAPFASSRYTQPERAEPRKKTFVVQRDATGGESQPPAASISNRGAGIGIQRATFEELLAYWQAKEGRDTNKDSSPTYSEEYVDSLPGGDGEHAGSGYAYAVYTIAPGVAEAALENKEVVKFDQLKDRLSTYAGEEIDSSTLVNTVMGTAQRSVDAGRFPSVGEAMKALFGWSDADVEKYVVNKETPSVPYLDENDRKQYEIVGGSTLMQGAPPSPFDTSEMFSKHSGQGFGIYVMSPGGQLYSHAHRVGLFHHSSFLAGLPTAGAGEWKVNRGRLEHITNKSGHYQPGPEQMLQTLKELKERGVNLSGVDLDLVSAENPRGERYQGDAEKFYQDHTRASDETAARDGQYLYSDGEYANSDGQYLYSDGGYANSDGQYLYSDGAYIDHNNLDDQYIYSSV